MVNKKVGNRIKDNSRWSFPIHYAEGLGLLGFQLLGFFCECLGSSNAALPPFKTFGHGGLGRFQM